MPHTYKQTNKYNIIITITFTFKHQLYDKSKHEEHTKNGHAPCDNLEPIMRRKDHTARETLSIMQMNHDGTQPDDTP